MKGGTFLTTTCQGALILQEVPSEYPPLSTTQGCPCRERLHSTCSSGVHGPCSLKSHCETDTKMRCGRPCSSNYPTSHGYPPHLFGPAPTQPFPRLWGTSTYPRTTTIFDFFWEQAHAKVGVTMQEEQRRLQDLAREATGPGAGVVRGAGGRCVREQPLGRASGPVQFLGCYRVYL